LLCRGCQCSAMSSLARVSGDRISLFGLYNDVVRSIWDVVEYLKVAPLVVWFRDPICTSFPPSYMCFRPL